MVIMAQQGAFGLLLSVYTLKEKGYVAIRFSNLDGWL
jgi:hypothetical protein